HGGFAHDGGGEQAAQRIALDALLVDLAGDRRRVLTAFGGLLELLDFRRLVGAPGVDALQAQRAFDGDLPVAEGDVVEDLRLFAFLEADEGVDDALGVGLGEFAVLLAQVLAQRLVPAGGVDQLHLALALRRLTIGKHPDIRGDAGVVEHVERQGDDGFQPVVLDDPSAGVAFALPGIAVNRLEPLCTVAMRLPSFDPDFILLSMLAMNSIWPSLERVSREYSGSPACSVRKRGSLIPPLPPMRSTSLFQLLP